MTIISSFSLFIGILASRSTSSITHAQTNHKKAVGCAPGSKMFEERPDKQVLELPSIVGSTTECVNGLAGVYPCSNAALESFVSLRDLNGGNQSPDANDIWGWSKNGREFAIIGLFVGTSFVEITDPTNPVVLGKLPTKTGGSIWRDIKTYDHYAVIVSEASGHGMQIFDLDRLLTVSSYQIFTEDAHYGGFGSAHNIFVNEDSGFAYAVGANRCLGGLTMINIIAPLSPTDAGCYTRRGYTHDVQCVIYDGPDTQHTGKEICFASNEDTVDIIDVTNKASPVFMSEIDYDNDQYTHQGWLTEDQKYFLIDDEMDEFTGSVSSTKSVIADVSNLFNPVIVNTYFSSTGAIDHNQYVKGHYSYQANYRAGLRILDLKDIEDGTLTEVAYFDTYPPNDRAQFNGAWSNYPYYDSGVVVISDIEKGLFVVRPNLDNGPTQTPTTGPTMSSTPFLSLSPTSPTQTPTQFSTNSSSLPPTIPTQTPTMGPTMSSTPFLSLSPTSPTQTPTQFSTTSSSLPPTIPTQTPTQFSTTSSSLPPVIPTQTPTQVSTTSSSLPPAIPTQTPTQVSTTSSSLPPAIPTLTPTQVSTTSSSLPPAIPTQTPTQFSTTSSSLPPAIPTQTPTQVSTNPPTQQSFPTSLPTSFPTASPTQTPTFRPISEAPTFVGTVVLSPLNELIVVLIELFQLLIEILSGFTLR